MKTVITREFLKKEQAARNGKTAAGLLVFPVLFCLAAFLFVPNKLVALGIMAFIVLFAGGLYLKYRSYPVTGYTSTVSASSLSMTSMP